MRMLGRRVRFWIMGFDRKQMIARVLPLHDPEAGRPPCPELPEARLELVGQLSREAWQLAGRAIPSYDRPRMPVTVRSLHERDRG
jgi:hypothetical protein